MTMTNRPVAPKVLMLCVPFVMLVAAKPYLRLHWMYLGLSGSLFLLITCLMLPVSVAWDGRRFAMALLTTYLWHQFEEHGVDIYGNRYAFQTSANKLLGPMLGCTPPGNSECPLTVDAIFWANTLLVWWPNALALTFGGERRQLLVCAAGVTLANTFAHVVPAMVMKSYNPGLVSVLLLFVPLDITILRNARRVWGAGYCAMALGFIWGALGHPFLLLAAHAIYWQEVAPTWVYPAVLFAYACLPLLVPQRFVLQIFDPPKRME
jgi:hypothetical protein